MKYANVKESGELLGWYDTDVHSTIPLPKIQVTLEEYNNSMAYNHNHVSNEGVASTVDFRTDFDIQEELNMRSYGYLRATDWYVIRKSETGVEIPTEVLTKRQESRVAITKE